MKKIEDVRAAIHTINIIEDTIKKLEEMLNPDLEMDELDGNSKTAISYAVMLLSQYMEDIKDTPIK